MGSLIRRRFRVDSDNNRPMMIGFGSLLCSLLALSSFVGATSELSPETWLYASGGFFLLFLLMFWSDD